MYQQITSNKRKSTLLVMIFILFITGLAWVFGQASGDQAFFFPIITLSVIMSFISYFTGDKMALWSTGAQPITKEQNPYVYRMTENLCIASGLPLPKIYIMPDSSPNAFATGRNPENASIALSTGIIELLENEELEAVIAHELSHIKNYDIRLMTLVMALVGVVSLLTDFFFHRLLWGGRDNKENSNPLFLVLGIVAMIIAPLVASLIRLAISRKREFLADADAALMTRYPEGLANALRKISASNKPMQKASTANAHLFFSNPLGKKNISSFFSTHPPTEDRIKALEKMGN